MAALTLRSVKGSELTAAEIDANFTNLNTDKLSSTAAGYPAIRPTLNLDFANSQSVDPRITFTRASTATRVRQDGLIEVVASGSPRIDFDPVTQVCKGLLIEEQRTNLLTYSENFDNAAWTKNNTTITVNATTAPDGSITADKLVENVGSGTKQLWQGGISYTAGTAVTLSFYAKAGERNFIVFGSGTPFSSTYGGYINLLTGVCVSNGVTAAVLSSINIENGWYRYSITGIPTTTMAGTSFDIRPSINGIDAGSYTGDGTSGVYVWGAQLEVGSFATSYIPSSDTFTSRASTATYVGSNGLIQSALTNVARYNYNPVNLSLAPKLLLESASTNLLTYSEQFDNAVWSKARSQINSNVIVAPDGTLTADKLVEDTQTGPHHVNKPGFVFTGGTTYCFSVYVQAAERSKGTLNLGNGVSGFGGGTIAIAYASYDLIAGTCVKSVYADSAGIQQLSGGWFRVWVVGTCTTGAADNVLGFLNNGTTTNYTGDGTSGLYIWGAQLEAGSFPTSYIPTVASQVTRAADISSSAQTTRVADNAVMTGTNFSSWYNQTEGTVLCKADHIGFGSVFPWLWAIDDNTLSNRLGIFIYDSGSKELQTLTRNSSIVQENTVISPAISINTMFSTIRTIKNNDVSACSSINTSIVSDTTVDIPNVSLLRIGSGDSNLNGHISKLSYYPKRLTDSELQALTTG